MTSSLDNRLFVEDWLTAVNGRRVELFSKPDGADVYLIRFFDPGQPMKQITSYDSLEDAFGKAARFVQGVDP